MTPKTKHYLAFLPSCFCALFGVVFLWAGERLTALSLWIDASWPKP